MPIKREVIYPIFLKCIKYAEDLFWKNIFEELAYNNCYNGSYISKGFFCSSIKGKEFTYKFLDKNELQLYNDITKLMKEKLNILSKNDKKVMIEEFEKVENELKNDQNIWENIKKKSIKEILIQNFLIKMKNKYKIRDLQIKKLYNLINLGFLLKSIKNTDIIYENGEIKKIEGIDFFNRDNTDDLNKTNNHGYFVLNIDIYSGIDEDSIISSPKNSLNSKKTVDNQKGKKEKKKEIKLLKNLN